MDDNETQEEDRKISIANVTILLILFCTTVVATLTLGWTVSGRLGGWRLSERRVDWLLLYLSAICLLDAVLDISFSLFTMTQDPPGPLPCRLSAAAAQWLSSQQTWLVCLLAVWRGGWMEAEKHPLVAVVTGCISGALAAIPILVGRTAVELWPAMMGCSVAAGDWCFYGVMTSLWLYGLPCTSAVLCSLLSCFGNKVESPHKEVVHVSNSLLAVVSVCFIVLFLPSIAVQQSLVDCSSSGNEVPWMVARIATWARYLGDTILPCSIFAIRSDLRRRMLSGICCNSACIRGSGSQFKRSHTLLLTIDHPVRETRPAPVVQGLSVLNFVPAMADNKKKRRKSYAYLSALMHVPGSKVRQQRLNALLWS